MISPKQTTHSMHNKKSTKQEPKFMKDLIVRSEENNKIPSSNCNLWYPLNQFVYCARKLTTYE